MSSRRGSSRNPAPGKSSSKQRQRNKYDDSSSEESDNAADDDDIRDWIVDDTGGAFLDDDYNNKDATTAKDKTIVNMMNKQRQGQSTKSSVFDDFDSGTGADLGFILGSKSGAGSGVDDLLNLADFTSFQSTGDDTGATTSLVDNLDQYMLAATSGFDFDLGAKKPSKTSSGLDTSAMMDTIAPDDYGFQDAGTFDDNARDDFDDPLADIELPAPQVDAQGDSSTTITTTTTTTSAKAALTVAEQKAQRELDQKQGIAVMGKIKEQVVVYEHESAAAADMSTADAQTEFDQADLVLNADDLAKYSNHYIYVYSIYEDTAVRDGRLYLFGRLLLNDIATNPTAPLTTTQLQTKSICIIVNDVERSLFFLPRKHPMQRGQVVANRTVSMEEVKAEVEGVLDNYGIDTRRMRVVSKKYCFGRRVSPNAFVQPGDSVLKKKKTKVVDDAEGDDGDDLGGLGDDDDDEDQAMGDDEKENNIEGDDAAPRVAASKTSGRFYRDMSLIDPINVIPAETHYLQVLYSTAHSQLPQSCKGVTFSHVFGTQTNRQESFIVDRQLKGPCWVAISSANAKLIDQPTVSWCDFEINLSASRHLTVVMGRDIPAPYFRSVSLSVKTALKLTSNNTYEKQIVMATIKCDERNNIELSKTRSQQLPIFSHTWSIVAPPNDTRLPFDWEEKRQLFNKRHARHNAELNVAANEASLLRILLHVLHQKSPDILIGHDLHGSVLDLLISRFHAHKLGQQWSKLGRLKRAVIPRHGVGTSRSLVDNGAGAGRLMVDTQLMAREFYHAKQYTLEYLTEQLLGTHLKVVDPLQVHDAFANSKSLEDLLNINIIDAEFQARIMHHLDIVPLTKQLTNLCGNTWHSSLRSSRAERVEYLLLHTFLQDGFIAPEPPVTQRPTPFNTTELDEFGYDTDPNSTNGNHRPVAGKANKKKPAPKKKKVVMGDEDGEDDEHQFFNENTLVDSDEEENKERQDKRDEAAGGPGAATAAAGTKKKVGYAGGKVLEPKRGFYNDWIAVLDFNSLYPSIIREYNLCFTTTEHWAIDIDVPDPNFDNFLPPLNAEVGILPNVVRMLIDRRKGVRRLLVTATTDNDKQMLNIKQLAFKLVANSLYGCLGFPSSRFYCRPIAACVTAKGRQALDNAISIAAGLNSQIIYGDTDSIMVNTQMQTYKDARNVAVRLKNSINKNYRVLTIDEDGYFKNMLLLRKKKYAAMKLEKVDPYDEHSFAQLQRELQARPDSNKFYAVAMPNVTLEGTDLSVDDPSLREKKENMNIFTFKREVKGLDMVRRDWSELCRKASSQVVDAVLRCDSASRDQVVQQITDLMNNINSSMANNLLDIDYYVITKQLTRSLEQYADFKKLPHVYVAWKASQRGKMVRAGDVVEFVMTTSESQGGANASQSDRAVSKEDYVNFVKHMERENKLSEADPTRTITPFLDFPSDMKLDLIYYKESQLLVPIMRLIDVLDELSTAKVADCLGLDSAKYALRERRDASGAGAGSTEDLEAEIRLAGSDNPADKFLDLPPFYISCPRCDVAFPFIGVYSYISFPRAEAYHSLPQAEKERLTFRTLPFQMHTSGYRHKMNQCDSDKTGFVCPTPGCPGLFDNGQMHGTNPAYSTNLDAATLANYLCNAVAVTIRDYIAQFERHQFIYTSKDLHNTLVTYGPDGNPLGTDQFLSTEPMAKGIEPQKVIHQLDVLNFIKYIEYLFDYPAQRKSLQLECDARLNRKRGAGSHSKSMAKRQSADKKDSVESSNEFYKELARTTLNEMKFYKDSESPEGPEVAMATQWTADEKETTLANLNSDISPHIIAVLATVKDFIYQSFLSRNHYNVASLAKIFSGYCSEL